jgi:hypothetical protein
MPVRDRLTRHIRPIRIRRVVGIASNLRQIAKPHRHRSPERNSHLVNTHHYRLKVASCNVLHDNSSPIAFSHSTCSCSCARAAGLGSRSDMSRRSSRRRPNWPRQRRIEFDGQRPRSCDAHYGPPRRGAGKTDAAHASSHDDQGFGEFDPGKVRAEAMVRAAAEGQHRRRPLAGDVEPFGVLVLVGVAIGGGRGDDNARAGRYEDSVEVHIFDRNTDGGKERLCVAHDLLYGLRSKFGMIGQQCPLVGKS